MQTSRYEIDSSVNLSSNHSNFTQVRPGCRAPVYCETSIEIIDAWTRVIDKRTKTKRYGLAAKISVSATLLSKARGQGYSILLRFPKELTKASYQGSCSNQN